MRSIAEFLSALTDALRVLLTRGGRYALIYGLIWIFQVWRLDLLHGTAITFLGTFFAWAVLWVFSTLRASGWVKVVPIVFLAWVTFAATFPGTATALTHWVRAIDTSVGQSTDSTEDASSAPRRIEPSNAPAPAPTPEPSSTTREVILLTKPPVDDAEAPRTDGLRPITKRKPRTSSEPDRLKPIKVRRKQ